MSECLANLFLFFKFCKYENFIVRNKFRYGLYQVTVRGEKCLVPVLQGLRKFTGGLGDDDDVPMNSDVEINQPWKAYFTKPIEFANTIISMDKANGEAAHLACRWIEVTFINAIYYYCYRITAIDHKQ